MKLPRIIYKCCGVTYDSYKLADLSYFKAFKHKTTNKKYSFGITVRLVCRNNNCITSFTFLFNDANEIIKTKKIVGKKYLKELQPFYIKSISMEPRTTHNDSDNWFYTKGNKTGYGGDVFTYKYNKKIKTEFSSVKESNAEYKEDGTST